MARTKSAGAGVVAADKRDLSTPNYLGSYGAVPEMNTGMRFTDIGSSGLRAFSGWVREEFLPQLQGRQGARTYREMLDNSPIVGAVMFAILGVMRKVDWKVERADDTPAAEEAAQFVESLKNDMSHTWEDFVVDALSMLGYGYAPHEIVYKRRAGRQKFGSNIASSLYDDGLIGWHRLPIRGQDTVLKWFFGANGEVLGMTQQPWVGPIVDIPMEKMLLFRPTQHKNNPEGRSILRTAYRSYYFIKRLEEQEAVLFERLSGLPVVRVPNELLEAAKNGNAVSQAALISYQKLVMNVRIDEQMGVLLPSNCYPDGTGKLTNVPMFDFKLETPNSGGRASMDADTPITRHKLDVMTSVLCDFLTMGHSSRGAQNLADTKVDLFMQAVESWLNSIAAVFNRYALPRIWAMNGKDPDLMPELTPDMAQRVDMDIYSNMILRLSQAGMPLFPDPDLEDAVRDTVGLPGAPEGGAPQEAVDQATGAAQAAQAAAVAQQQPDPKDVPPPPQRSAKRARLEGVVRNMLVDHIRKSKRP